jgi:hypothetical protein
LNAYIFGDDLYLELQYDVKISAVVIPSTSPPLIPKAHRNPNNTTHVLSVITAIIKLQTVKYENLLSGRLAGMTKSLSRGIMMTIKPECVILIKHNETHILA